jgi:hypothetical protein
LLRALPKQGDPTRVVSASCLLALSIFGAALSRRFELAGGPAAG